MNLIEESLHFTTKIARFLTNENFSDADTIVDGHHTGMSYETEYSGVSLIFKVCEKHIKIEYGKNKGGHISHYYYYKKNSFNSFQKAYKKMVNKREFLEDLEAIPCEEYSEEYRLYLELKEKYD